MKGLFKFIRFGIVGFSGTIIDFGVTALVMLVCGYKEYISESIESISQSSGLNGKVLFFILFANLVGFIMAASSNFVLNRIWTWKSTDPNICRQYLKFFVVSVCGLLINLSIIYICNRFLSFEFSVCGILITRFWIAKIIATAIVMIWNFIINNIYTFAKSVPDEQ